MRILLLLFCCSLLSSHLFTQNNNDDIEKALFDLPDVRFEHVASYADHQVFKLKVKQPLDHMDPDKGYFYQLVTLEHRGFDKPVVMNTNGYNLSKRTPEMVALLDANLLNIEHRYFGESRPDSLDCQ